MIMILVLTLLYFNILSRSPPLIPPPPNFHGKMMASTLAYLTDGARVPASKLSWFFSNQIETKPTGIFGRILENFENEILQLDFRLFSITT